jgi:hypothetical protein
MNNFLDFKDVVKKMFIYRKPFEYEFKPLTIIILGTTYII